MTTAPTPLQKAEARYETARRTYWFATTNYVEDLREEYDAAKADLEALRAAA